MFSKKRVRYCNCKEFNEHLKYCRTYRNIYFREKLSTESFRNNAYMVDRQRYIEISYKLGTRACTYILDKSSGDETDHQMINGAEAFRILSMYYKVPKLIDSKDDAKFSAIPLLWKNDNYEGKRVNAICYDMNSAYSNAMLKDIPDTSKPPVAKKVGKGEVGFRFDENGNVCLTYDRFAPFVFKTMPSPFAKFVEKYYNKKRKAKTKLEKRKAKEILNFCVGFLQGRNEFLRAFIVCTANDIIKSLIDENTIYCNTDSIVSLVERPELKIGDEVGEWKVEHRGDFAFKGFNYQWNKDTPSVRGVTKSYFPKGWDILKDPMPVINNLYELDYGKFTMKVVKNAKSKKELVEI